MQGKVETWSTASALLRFSRRPGLQFPQLFAQIFTMEYREESSTACSQERKGFHRVNCSPSWLLDQVLLNPWFLLHIRVFLCMRSFLPQALSYSEITLCLSVNLTLKLLA